MYQNRDFNINYIKARRDRRCYGMGLGIIILDDVYPGFPGDVRNASAYPFPIQYEIAERVDIKSMAYAKLCIIHSSGPSDSSWAGCAG